ncbi:MAG: NAD-dependent epimerase/dehydratase family protein [Armatimonadota bacterium]
MKVCVVGGTGNISTSIVRLLLLQGHEVTCCNRGQCGTPPEGVRSLCFDRNDRMTFEQAMQAERFDAAIDMICFTADDAASSHRAFRGVQHFIHCSTVCTYGVQYDWLPVSEDHPLRPFTSYGHGKVAADAYYLEAYYREGFPVTILKPSTTYGPKLGLLRQVAWDFSWIDRVRKGKPILVCGDGVAIHQFLHVDDAAQAFVFALGKDRCFGQVYNLVGNGFISWADYHKTAMRVLGQEVELVGVPLEALLTHQVPNVDICRDIFAHNVYYSNAKLLRDLPEFHPVVMLEMGMQQVIETLDREGRIPNSDELLWEDRLIEAQSMVTRRLTEMSRILEDK